MFSFGPGKQDTTKIPKDSTFQGREFESMPFDSVQTRRDRNDERSPVSLSYTPSWEWNSGLQSPGSKTQSGQVPGCITTKDTGTTTPPTGTSDVGEPVRPFVDSVPMVSRPRFTHRHTLGNVKVGSTLPDNLVETGTVRPVHLPVGADPQSTRVPSGSFRRLTYDLNPLQLNTGIGSTH